MFAGFRNKPDADEVPCGQPQDRKYREFRRLYLPAYAATTPTIHNAILPHGTVRKPRARSGGGCAP